MEYIDNVIKDVGKKVINKSIKDFIYELYGIELYANQLEVFSSIVNPLNHYILVNQARGGGKTFSVSLGIHFICSQIPNLKVGIFAPKYGQSKKVLIQIAAIDKKICKIDKSSSSTTHIVFKNGSQVFSDSAHEKANIEGEHYNCIFIDECHKTSDYAVSNKILPMLGSFKYYQLVKAGVSLFKNNFYRSFLNNQFKKVIHNWLQCDILKRSGVISYNGVDYPKYIVEMMPYEKKVEYFKDKVNELPKTGEISLMDFITQYELTWLENIQVFLSEKQINLMSSGIHKELVGYDNDGVFVFGLDTNSGTINPNTMDTDNMALSIFKFKKGMMLKVGAFEWGDRPMEHYHEVVGIIKQFNCVYGLIDYSNVGIAFVSMFKNDDINCDGIMYSMHDPISHKNFKQAMLEHFQTCIDKIRYPKIYDDDSKKILVSDTMYKSFIQWTVFEMRKKESGHIEFSAPQGEKDDHVNADILAVYSFMKMKNVNVDQVNAGIGFEFTGSRGSILSR